MDGNNLFVKQAKLNRGSSALVMQGSVKNLLSLFYSSPEKIVLDWQIKSPLVNIDDFKSFLGKRKKIQYMSFVEKPRSRAERIAAQLDRIMDQGDVHMTVNVNKLIYHNFIAENINAEVTLKQSDILLQNVRVSHAGGTLKLNANIDQKGPINRFTVNSHIEHIDVKQFFTSFENFGQDAVIDKNIRGTLNADINVAGSMYDNAKIVPASFEGTVGFKLQKGALLNFSPFEKLGKIIFRRRDMSNVTFADLENTLEIKGSKIIIRPMHIQSSAITFNVEGVYALKTGTEIFIDVSMRNPEKDELLADGDMKTERSMKGIIMHLRAIDGDDGNVNIKWSLRDKKKKTEL